MVDLLLSRGNLCFTTHETGSQFTRQSKIDGILVPQAACCKQCYLLRGEE
jgi:hypothetical protein